MRCDQPGQSECGLIELTLDPDQLDRADDPPADARGNKQSPRAHLVVLLDPRPGGPGGEQGPGRCNRARNEHVLLLVEHARDGEVGPGHLLGGGGDQLQGLRE